MSYEDNIKGLGERVAGVIEGLWTTHSSGGLTFEEFRSSAVQVLSAAQQKGAAVAELTLAGYFQQAGLAVPAFTAVVAPDESERLAKSVATVAASDLDSVMQLRRLATSEVYEAAGNAFQRATRDQPRVKGYTRGLESGACQLCVWLAKEGYVYPDKQPMHRHTGCLCHPKPAFR